MKRIFKFFLFIVLINSLTVAGLFVWIGTSSIAPSFKESGITFSDLFKKELDPVKKAKLEKAVYESSSKLGRNAAKGFIDAFKVILPSSNIDFSKMPAEPYPYPSIDEVMEANNKAVEKGIAEGLEILKEAEKQNHATKQKALEEANK
jgi:hypothetical protein